FITLSLHDALPIFRVESRWSGHAPTGALLTRDKSPWCREGSTPSNSDRRMSANVRHRTDRWAPGPQAQPPFWRPHMTARTAPIHLALAVMAMAATAFSTQAAAQAAFYEKEAYTGRSLSASEQVRNLRRQGFEQAAESVVVAKGKRWEVCD